MSIVYSTRPRLLGGFGNEIGKGLADLVAGWRGLAVQMITFPLFYLLIVLFMGRGQLRAELLLPVGIGMVALTFIHEQVNRMFWSYQGDIQSGVLEQTYLTPLPSWVLILGRQIASIVAALPTALSVGATGYVAIVANGGSVHFDPRVVVPLAAIAVGTCGLALVLCGLTLVYKRIQIITQVSVAVYAIAGGTLVPLTDMPGWTAVVARLAVPIAPGIEAMRDILLDGDSLAGLSTGWGPGWLLLQPLLIAGAGVLVFSRLERIAKRRGTLGRY
ncbi:ABC transporter permease [Stackebrandtia nassauensis]|uniref:ABC-2 type transporter n=1 Tax=Stackebrandtia nassauensis (strain DSM 44728 / CIP 108903 / NRRL B-16338 / NBRC 102104 / LLR-40K-21) TaxID=446470 RepID=D3Q6B4_STANL|nr:ABC transporter permease [Stackebrandtia nassauensis]ADD42289.1 ABC-2 type transporter [Stackebrandtia nassauensis DSM 44728]